MKKHVIKEPESRILQSFSGALIEVMPDGKINELEWIEAVDRKIPAVVVTSPSKLKKYYKKAMDFYRETK